MQASEVIVAPFSFPYLLEGDLQLSLQDLGKRLYDTNALAENTDLKLTIILEWLMLMVYKQQINVQTVFTHLQAIATQVGYTDMPDELRPIDDGAPIDAELRQALESVLQNAVQLRSI